MSRYLLLFIILFAPTAASAQTNDSIFAVRKAKDLVIKYTAKAGESVFMISKRFFASQEKIESMSMVDGRKKLLPGTDLYIPLVSRDNFHASKDPVGMENQQEVYYRVKENDNIGLISLFAGMQKQELLAWNNLRGNTLAEGQVLFIGWAKIVARDSINLSNGIAYPSKKPRKAVVDTEKHAFGELDSLYNIQTRGGTNTISEKGTVVFFDKGGNNKIYFAFHNTSQPGTIIKVFNPGSGKTIYAKVLAAIPDTKLYANAIIGICSAAKDALGVTDNKAWCELSYSPN